jgi:hypothetical protein
MGSKLQKFIQSNVIQLVAINVMENKALLSAQEGAPSTAWRQRLYGTCRPDVLEVFGGHAEISLRASMQGWMALQPIDKVYGSDLQEARQREELFDSINECQPLIGRRFVA